MKEEKNQKEEKKDKEKELQEAFEKCEKERAEYLAGWQRARADFINFKNEEAERFSWLFESVRAELFLKFIKIMDNFERAKIQIPENLKNDNFFNGFLQIETQIRDFLKEEGIQEIETAGKKFDPNFHEAIEEVKIEDKEPGIITEVLEKGYLINDKVLRPAKVKVSK